MIDALPFNEIHLLNDTVVHWRLGDQGWEIAAYRSYGGGGMPKSVTGEPIKRTLDRRARH